MTRTPGPWTAPSGGAYSGLSVYSDGWRNYPTKKVVCTVRPYPRTVEAYQEGRANARLIAAAPDLLAALREARSVLKEIQQETDGIFGRGIALGLIESAIAKAEGG